MKPHKHAEIIKAWADGSEIEYQVLDGQKWWPVPVDAHDWRSGAKYRIKPEPPKYPQTTLKDHEFHKLWMENSKDVIWSSAISTAIANAAIARAIEDGDVVPASIHDRAIRALKRSGFVDNGAEEWKPPVNEAAVKLRHAEQVLIDAGFSYSPDEGWSRPADMVPADMLEEVANEAWDSARAWPEMIVPMAKSVTGKAVIASIIETVKQGK
jgi:hypothetical protein